LNFAECSLAQAHFSLGGQSFSSDIEQNSAFGLEPLKFPSIFPARLQGL